jgi:hypothetical protein
MFGCFQGVAPKGVTEKESRTIVFFGICTHLHLSSRSFRIRSTLDARGDFKISIASASGHVRRGWAALRF